MANVRRKKSLMTNHSPICAVADCGKPSTSTYVFCVDHMHRAYPCAVQGCERPISAYNKSGYCYDHRWVAQKVARMKLADERDARLAKATEVVKKAAKPIVKRKTPKPAGDAS